MDLSIVMGVLNQFDIAVQAIQLLIERANRPKDLEFIIIDNGSVGDFGKYLADKLGIEHLSQIVAQITIVKNQENVGNYPLFSQGLIYAKAPVVAFFHSDLFVYQKGWDTSIVAHFDANQDLGLVGFIGSTQLDSFGGRGSGTHSNFQGLTLGKWSGSKAEVHGRKDEGFIIAGAVVDGCSMIFRTKVLASLEVKPDYPPHHFYDRMMSAQVIEAGYKVGILGIACDHISGQTANQENKWHDTAKAWCEKNLGITEPKQWVEKNKAWFQNTMNPSRGQTPGGWDHVIYLEAEKRFLTEYRDVKHIVPIIRG